MIFSSKEEAAASGSNMYSTGLPCKNGHLSNRYVKSGLCVECSLKRYKRWADKNRGYIRQINKKYNPQRKECTRLWRLKNLEECREYDRKRYPEIAVKKRQERRNRYWKNPDREREYNRKWRKENPEKAALSVKKWNTNNPEKRKLADKVNGAMRRSANGKHTTKDILDILQSQNHQCAYCRTKLEQKYHVDHITAIARGGTNHRRNLQILCAPCNKSKHARDPIEFAQSLGFLI